MLDFRVRVRVLPPFVFFGLITLFSSWLVPRVKIVVNIFDLLFFWGAKQQDFIKKKNKLQDPTKKDTKPYIEGGKNDIRHDKRRYKEGRKTTTTNNKNYNNITITTTNKPTTTTPNNTKLDQHPEVFKSNHSNQCPEQQ